MKYYKNTEYPEIYKNTYWGSFALEWIDGLSGIKYENNPGRRNI